MRESRLALLRVIGPVYVVSRFTVAAEYFLRYLFAAFPGRSL